MKSSGAAPIIIKKKIIKGGHHGGAWKVAYADFVTAMMALFIVLWLMNASPEAQEAIGGYFKDPTGAGKQRGSAMAGVGESIVLDKAGMENLQKKLSQAMYNLPEFKKKLKDNVEMSVTGEGLRIELLETEKGLFFETGSPQPSSHGKELIARLAQELGQLPNPIVIEGHTDSRPFGKNALYSNWELSTDRANSARRLMLSTGLQPHQVKQVRGYADQTLRDRTNPENAANRRISVIVRYAQDDKPDAAPAAEPAKAHAAPAPAAHAPEAAKAGH